MLPILVAGAAIIGFSALISGCSRGCSTQSEPEDSENTPELPFRRLEQCPGSGTTISTHSIFLALALSPDDRYVAYSSTGEYRYQQIFLADRRSGNVELISQGNGDRGEGSGRGPSRNPSISENGRFIAFRSQAPNLIPNVPNNRDGPSSRIFLHDRQTHENQDLSEGFWCRTNNPSLSSDGEWVAFDGCNPEVATRENFGSKEIYLFNRQTGSRQRITNGIDGELPNEDSYSPAIDGNGNSVVFQSSASNLVREDTNGHRDIFLFNRENGNRENGEIQRISEGLEGQEANGDSARPSISADGRWVAFESRASNLEEGDTNDRSDIFLHDTETGNTERVSLNSDGSQREKGSYDAMITPDGRFVLYTTQIRTGYPLIYFYDRQTRTNRRFNPCDDTVPVNWRLFGSHWFTLANSHVESFPE